MSTFKLTTLSEAAQIKKFGEILITPDTEFELHLCGNQYATAENKGTAWFGYNRELFVHYYANKHGYSDIYPYEVIEHNSPLKMTLRAMDAELDPNWKMDVSVGGFAGHVNNNHTQTYEYTSNPENSVVEIRYSKAKRIWRDKFGNRYIVSRKPYKHYDYNF